MKRIVIIGGGFAGLWSAVGAAYKLDELSLTSQDVEITVINRDGYHAIRVRNYEADLTGVRVPLEKVLTPIGVKWLKGNVTEINYTQQTLSVQTHNGITTLSYDRLVLAAGSQLYQPNLPGLQEYAFSVDTYNEAIQLNKHLNTLSQLPPTLGHYTAVIVGAGLTGIETACEMPDRLRSSGQNANIRVILADHSPLVGSTMGDDARPVIQEALSALGVELRMGVSVQTITPQGLILDTGEQIEAKTIVWTAGMRASPLTQQFPIECDRWGRLWVDEFMKVQGLEKIFAAGDSAAILIDGIHPSVMSCQHGRPMGRFAGYNVVCDLLGEPMLPLQIDWYVTVLDLGSWGAVYTHGWERRVVAQGLSAKKTKQQINCVRIYPPLSGDRHEILNAGAPYIQSPPEQYHLTKPSPFS